MDILKGDRAFITGGVLKIRNIPVLYLPAWYLPLTKKEKAGFYFLNMAKVMSMVLITTMHTSGLSTNTLMQLSV